MGGRIENGARVHPAHSRVHHCAVDTSGRRARDDAAHPRRPDRQRSEHSHDGSLRRARRVRREPGTRVPATACALSHHRALHSAVHRRAVARATRARDTQRARTRTVDARGGRSRRCPPTMWPLTGVRVVDMTAFWAGPYATYALACLGADVIHVESVQRPDGMRFGSVRPPSIDEWWEWGPTFHSANAGKRSVTLDLTRDDGRALLRRLIEQSDVLVENYSARVMEQFGLSWDVIQSWNPRSSWCACRRSGSTGHGAIASASRRRWSKCRAWRG